LIGDFEVLARQRIEESIAVKQALLQEPGLVQLVVEIGHRLAQALSDGHRFFLFGNGGSAADAQHIAAELVGRYKLERPGLPAFALTVNTSSLTAIANDCSYEVIFSRQLEAMALPADVALGISTSGNSRDVLSAVEAAKRKGMVSIGLTGRGGGQLKALADYCICVPSDDTPRVQEAHIMIGHLLAEMVELELFGKGE
jgi:D-sedoheptulose 7-phosphate isomerase